MAETTTRETGSDGWNIPSKHLPGVEEYRERGPVRGRRVRVGCRRSDSGYGLSRLLSLAVESAYLSSRRANLSRSCGLGAATSFANQIHAYSDLHIS
jgi:hypothetical protein